MSTNPPNNPQDNSTNLSPTKVNPDDLIATPYWYHDPQLRRTRILIRVIFALFVLAVIAIVVLVWA